MVRVKNTTGGTKTILGSQYLGGLTYEVDDRLLEFFIKNRFEILDSVETESAPVEETLVEETVTEEVDETEVLDFSSMTKREIQVWLREQGISYKLSDNKAALLSLTVLEEE
jgi:hypothetical protein